MPYKLDVYYFVRGLNLVTQNRELWSTIWKPWLISALLFFAILIGGFLLWVPIAGNLAERWGVTRIVGTSIGTAVYAVVWWFVSGVVYLGLTGLASSLLWDKLSQKIELFERGVFARSAPSFGWQVYDTLIRLPFTIFIVFGSLLFGWFCFGIIAIGLAGWLGLFDYSACAYIRRNILFTKQFMVAPRAPGALGFILISGLITLMPVVNVLLLPAMVAGGTLLCLAERKRAMAP